MIRMAILKKKTVLDGFCDRINRLPVMRRIRIIEKDFGDKNKCRHQRNGCSTDQPSFYRHQLRSPMNRQPMCLPLRPSLKINNSLYHDSQKTAAGQKPTRNIFACPCPGVVD
jgi:hypothetical protein